MVSISSYFGHGRETAVQRTKDQFSGLKQTHKPILNGHLFTWDHVISKDAKHKEILMENIFDLVKELNASKEEETSILRSPFLLLTPELIGFTDKHFAAIGYHRTTAEATDTHDRANRSFYYLAEEGSYGYLCDIISCIGILYEKDKSSKLKIKSIIIEEIIIALSTNQKWISNTQVIDNKKALAYLSRVSNAYSTKVTLPLRRCRQWNTSDGYEEQILEMCEKNRLGTYHLYSEKTRVSKNVVDNMFGNATLERQVYAQLEAARINAKSRIEAAEINGRSRIIAAKIIGASIIAAGANMTLGLDNIATCVAGGKPDNHGAMG